MSRESWLDSESERWQQDGLISEETRRAILARYPRQAADPSRALIPLAVLTAGVGVILLVVWHWQDLPAAAKLGLTSALTVALYGVAAWSSRRGATTYTEAWLLAAALGSYTLISALADVYLASDVALPTLLCAVMAAVTAALTGGVLVTALAAGTLGWWLLVVGGGPLPWQFPLVWIGVAFAAEQARHRALSGLVAIVFAEFAVMMSAATWDSLVQASLFAILAGAALEHWALQPEQQRPAFARLTPARAIAIGGLAVGLLSAIHSTRESWTNAMAAHTGHSPWPALVLGAGLAVVAMWPTRVPTWRARGLVLVPIAWFAVAAAGARGLGWLGVWPWITVFSAALLLVGATLVREAALSHDRGTFILGLAAVLLLVIAHFTSAQAAGLQGGVVLLVSAAVLFWVARWRMAPEEKRP